MVAKGKIRGHEMVRDNNQWRYVDTGELVSATWKDRPCGHCGRHATADGHDPCIASLPGVRNACCGHGNQEESYIQFENGFTVRGFVIDGPPSDSE